MQGMLEASEGDRDQGAVADWRAGPWIVDHNPCFALSGLLMLGGCYLVSSAAHAKVDEAGPVVILMLLIAAYQALAALAGLSLPRHGPARRDIAVLGLTVVLLATDLPMVQHEVVTALPVAGTLLWLLSLSVGMACAGALLQRLGVDLTPAGWGWLAAAMGTCGVLSWSARMCNDGGFLSGVYVYGSAWAVGALLAAGPTGWRTLRGRKPLDASAALLIGAVVVLPMVVAVLRWWAATWTYSAEWGVVHTGPIALGLGLAIIRSLRDARGEILATICWGYALVVSAISVREVPDLWWNAEGFELTPWRWMLWAMMVLMWVSAWRSRRYLLRVPIGMLLGVVSLLGRDLVTSDRTFWRIARGLSHDVEALSVLGVGYTAVAIAFVLLGAGWWWGRRSAGKSAANGCRADTVTTQDVEARVDQSRAWLDDGSGQAT